MGKEEIKTIMKCPDMNENKNITYQKCDEAKSVLRMKFIAEKAYISKVRSQINNLF